MEHRKKEKSDYIVQSVDRALDICRLYQTIPDAASDANFAALEQLLNAESQRNPAFGEIRFVAASKLD